MTRTLRRHSLKILMLCTTLFLLSCSKNIVYSEYHTFDRVEWKSAEKAEFEVEITDTQNLHNISLMVRHAEGYPYRNLFLFVTTAYPDGKVLKDTMEIVLSNEKGEWLGSGVGDIFDYKVPVKSNLRFALAGKYKFSFEHGMRVDPLPMVMDFGLEIARSN